MDDSTEAVLAELRQRIKACREEGKKIIASYKRFEREYDSWEDQVNEIEKAILIAEEETGLTKEEIIKEPDILDDILGELEL